MVFHIYFLPVALILSRGIHFYSISGGSSIFVPKLNHEDMQYALVQQGIDLAYVDHNVQSECIDVYSETLVSGYCNLPEFCYSTIDLSTEHTWYGSKVKICAGIDRRFQAKIVRRSVNIYSFNMDLVKNYLLKYKIKVVEQSFNSFYVMEDLNTGYFSFLSTFVYNAMVSNLNYTYFLRPTGDWHQVNMFLVPYHDLGLLTFGAGSHLKILNVYDFVNMPHLFEIKSHYIYAVCTNGSVHSSIRSNETIAEFRARSYNYDYPVSLDKFISSSVIYSNSNVSKICPLDYVYSKTDKYKSSFLIRTQTDNMITHLIRGAGGLAIKAIDYLYQELLKIVEPILEITLKAIVTIVSDYFNILIQFLETETIDLERLAYILSKLLKILIMILVKIVYILDKQVHFVEILFIFMYVYYKFKRMFIALTVIVLLYPLFPDTRYYPSLLEYFYNFPFNFTS